MKGRKESYRMEFIWAILLVCVLGCTNGHAHNGAGTDSDVNSEKPGEIQQVGDKFAWQPLVYDSTKKYIYLTFDDGPQHGTVECYNLVKQAGVKASFFMVGLHAARKSDGKKIVSMIRKAK